MAIAPSNNLAEIDVYPNPFDREVRFAIYAPESGRIRIYNVLGEEIKVMTQPAGLSGETEIVWNISEEPYLFIPSGIYLYTIELDDIKVASGKIVKQ